MVIHPVVVWITNIHLMVTLKSQGSTKIIRIHPLETMNICTKFYGSLSNSYWDILVWTKVMDFCPVTCCISSRLRAPGLEGLRLCIGWCRDGRNDRGGVKQIMENGVISHWVTNHHVCPTTDKLDKYQKIIDTHVTKPLAWPCHTHRHTHTQV